MATKKMAKGGTGSMSGPARPAPKTSTGTMGSRAGVTAPKPASKPAAAPARPATPLPPELANKFKDAFAARKAGVKPPINSFGGMGMKKGGKAKKK
jgi:hypothetical protein